MVGAEHLDTPRKAHIKGTIKFLEACNIPFNKKDVYEFNEVSERTGQRVLNSDTDKTHYNNPVRLDNRRKKRKATEEVIDKFEQLFNDEGFEGKRLHPAELPDAAGVPDISARTVTRSLKRRRISKYIAQEIDYIDLDLQKRRKAWAEKTLALQPLAANWEVIYFSDEVHFGYDDEGKVCIFRRPGTRNNPENLKERKEPEEKDKKRLHAWACISIRYKSPLVFYEIPTNNNRKITQSYYETKILDKHIKPLIKEGQTFILEEDNDSSHGPNEKSFPRPSPY
ncbi:HMG box [Fusarium phyllophilum]|uniref:HMG box n=1 Tax=Fusarium phyllophilum TaxID=47803 RepID=A0A8H5IZA4_9HYPO|nr:HMG box [Fusarium phyllophilum]